MASNVVTLRDPVKLLNYDAACQALAKAVKVDDVKDILNVAERLKLYGKQAKDPQAIRDAIAIRERAEYELGVLLEAQRRTVGLAKGAAEKGTKRERERGKLRGVNETPRSVPTLAEGDINKNLAKRVRRAVKLPRNKAMAEIEKRRQGIYPAPKPRRVMMHDIVDVSDDPDLSFDYDIEQTMHAAKDEREGLLVTDEVLAKVQAVIDTWKKCLKRLEESHGQKVA